MVRRARAHRLVVRVRRVLLPAGVSDGGLEDALVLLGREVLQEDVLDAPEAPSREGRHLGRAAACGCGSKRARIAVSRRSNGMREIELRSQTEVTYQTWLP